MTDIKRIVKLCNSVSSFAGFVSRDLQDNYIEEGRLPLPCDIAAFLKELRGCIALLREAKSIFERVDISAPYAAVLEPVLVAVEVEG